MLQVTSIAELSSNKNRSIRFECIDIPYDIIIIARLEDTYFSFDQLFKFGSIPEELFGNNFDGHNIF